VITMSISTRVIPAVPVTAADPTAVRPRRTATIGLLRLEVVRMAGDKRFLLLMIGIPIGMYLLFTNLPGSNTPSGGLSPSVAVMISMSAFGAIGTTLSATAPRIAQERTNGWMRQLRILPVSGGAVIVAKVLAAMVWALPAILAVMATAELNHHVSLAAWRWVAIVALLWLGTAPFAALGLLIGYLTDDTSAFAVMYGVYLFLGAAGGLWMPASVLPTALRRIATVLPSNRMAEFGWSLAAGHTPSLAGAAILAGWLVGFAGLAALLYRRSAAVR
jgi:ABC-2 type transport system permease protein